MLLTNEHLLPLAEVNPFLEKVEAALYQAKQDVAAKNLAKLQEDAGVQIDREFNGVQSKPAKKGSKTAKLEETYTTITAGRFNSVLRMAYASMPNSQLKEEFKMLLIKLIVPEQKPAAPRHPTARAG